MTQHTPGPWRVGREIGESQLMPRIEILRDVTFAEGVRPTTYYLAEVCYPTTTGNTVGAEERRANARLIAAAPDLLAALIGLLPQTFTGNPSRAEEVAHWERERDLGNGNAPFVLAAFAAIAAATGTPT